MYGLTSKRTHSADKYKNKEGRHVQTIQDLDPNFNSSCFLCIPYQVKTDIRVIYFVTRSYETMAC